MWTRLQFLSMHKNNFCLNRITIALTLYMTLQQSGKGGEEGALTFCIAEDWNHTIKLVKDKNEILYGSI